MCKMINTMQINKVQRIITSQTHIYIEHYYLFFISYVLLLFAPRVLTILNFDLLYFGFSQLFCYFTSKKRYQGFFLILYNWQHTAHIVAAFFTHKYSIFWDSGILLCGSVIIPLIWIIIFHCMNMLSSCHLPMIDICIFWSFCYYSAANECFCTCFLVYLCKYKRHELTGSCEMTTVNHTL